MPARIRGLERENESGKQWSTKMYRTINLLEKLENENLINNFAFQKIRRMILK